MLVLHERTIAFLCTISTTIQCVLWIIGYILYILAYSCGFNSVYFNPLTSDTLPTDLGSYYIWYLQGFNCTTSPVWINSIRHQSPEVLVGLISVGFIWNALLLTSSLYMLAGFFSVTTKLGLRLKIYVYTVLLVSAWDLILIVVVSTDFSPLMAKHSYINSSLFNPNNTTKPSIMALPYFYEVFTVIIILLSRLFIFWILNIIFASYLLAKKASGGTRIVSSPVPSTLKNNVTRNELWANKPEEAQDDHSEPAEKEYFPTNPLQRQIPPLPTEYPADEVSQRWQMSVGKQENYSFTDNEMDRKERPNESGKGILKRNYDRSVASPIERMEDVPNHTNNSDRDWRNVETNSLPKVKLTDSVGINTLERKPSVKKDLFPNMRHSFSLKHRSLPPDIPEDPSEQKKQVEGFSYINKPGENNIFNIKLKHVRRDSITNRASGSVKTENSGNSGGEASPYLISPIASLDLDYVPQEHLNLSMIPPISPNYRSELPPPLPPPVAPSFNSLGFRPQMSLEEAIATRRPLRPVNRPAIDTMC